MNILYSQIIFNEKSPIYGHFSRFHAVLRCFSRKMKLQDQKSETRFLKFALSNYAQNNHISVPFVLRGIDYDLL